MICQYQKRFCLILVVIICCVGLLPKTTSAAQKKNKRYNVLFFFSDDQRRDTIATLGNKHIETPNLDKLVRSGVFFKNAYCMGSMGGAVCVPSRAMMMSGRPLFRVPTNLRNVLTLAQYFQQMGYITFGTGKWHNGGESFARSFEVADAVMLGGMSDHFNVPLSYLEKGGFTRYSAKGKHSSEIFADSAITFLKNQVGKGKSKNPFFMYVAFQAPHDPRDAPKKYLQKYYKKRPPLPENYMPQHPFNNGHMVLRDENLAPWPRTKETVRDQLAEYYALITHMDHQIGRILQALRDTGEYENTIIVFAADHGLAVGSHGLLGKQNIYDHSMGTPMLFAGPEIPNNEQRDALVYLFDIFPTLCELNHLKIPKSVEGKSLAKILQGKEKQVRDSIYLNYRDLQRGIRDDRWKLICYPRINHVQLFDLKNDPDELKNLAKQPELSGRVKQLKKMILAWERKLGRKPRPLVSPNPQPMKIDLTGRKRTPDRWQPKWIREKYFGK